MEGIVSALGRRDKQRLLQNVRSCTDDQLKTRDLIVLLLLDGTSPTHTAQRLRVSRSTVYRVAQRFREWGKPGWLIDAKTMANVSSTKTSSTR